MESKMIWANLVSEDLDKTEAFFEAIGFSQTPGPKSDKLRSFQFGSNQFVINFFTRERMEQELNGKYVDAHDRNEIMFSLSAENTAEVDLWYEKVKAAGASIFLEPQPFEEGYTFGFADPDGHKFNVLYWPGM